jgi:protein TonB
MTEVVWPLPTTHEVPIRRLLWVLPAAILLVLLALLVLGNWLRSGAVPTPRPRPMEARIYELPPAPGAAPSAPARPAPAHPRQPIPIRPRPRSRPAKPAARAEIAPARGTLPIPTAKPRAPAPAAPRIDWAKLHRDVNAAVATATGRRSAPFQIKDPNTLTAHFYIASVLRKLQEVGNLNYPGQLTGVSVVRLRIDVHGRLVGLKILKSPGSPALDRAAEGIVRMSAPFAPLPSRLRRKTPGIELTLYMDFYGYRQLYTEY